MSLSQKRLGGAVAGGVLALGVLLAYANTLKAPFVYDDLPNVLYNQSIRSLEPLWAPFFPPANAATAGRPLVNASYALNYAISGVCPWSYHLGNVLVHLAATLTLFGLVRRSFAMPALAQRYGDHAQGLGFAVALLWGLHPLQTHAVTYVSQRTESMMGFFLLLTMYAAVRGWQQGARRTPWHLLAVACCMLGVGCKEVIVAAPLLVWLYDVLLRERGWLRSLQESPLLYAGLLVCMGLLAVLVSTGATEQTGALHPDRSWWEYLLVQAQVLLHYGWIMLWPLDAAFDYVWPVPTVKDTLAPLLLVGLVVLLALAGAVRRRVWSYPLLWFLLLLAPTSSFLPMMFPAAAYRLYLPLAGAVALVTALGWNLCCKYGAGTERLGGVLLFALAICSLAGTVLENKVFSDPLLLWGQTVRRQPQNHRAQHWVGTILLQRGYVEESVPYFRQALALQPDYARARGALGKALLRTGRLDDAQEAFLSALDENPDLIVLYWDLALLHLARGEHAAAVARLEIYLQRNPGDQSARDLLQKARELAQEKRKWRRQSGSVGLH